MNLGVAISGSVGNAGNSAGNAARALSQLLIAECVGIKPPAFGVRAREGVRATAEILCLC